MAVEPMVRALDAFPHHLADGAAAGARAAGERPSSVLLCGMGGSGIGGALAEAWLAPVAHAPLATWKEEVAPSYLGPGHLVVAVSYSGQTGETLAVARGALQAGARLVAITTGGALAELARKHDMPVVEAPAGIQPRSALGFLFGATVGVVEANDIVSGQVDEVAAAARSFAGVPAALRTDAGSPARALAAHIGPHPTDIVGHDLMGVAAQRFATQLDENAKVPATWHVLPEAAHNAIVAWSSAPSRARLVLLRRAGESPLEEARFDHLKEEAKVEDVAEVRVEGSGIAQALRAILIGDAASVLVAEKLGRDPEEVGTIGRLKQRLRALGSG